MLGTQRGRQVIHVVHKSRGNLFIIVALMVTIAAGAIIASFADGRPAAALSAAKNQFWHEASPGILGSLGTDNEFGTALAAGDFDGDGASDLASGVPGESVGPETDAGKVQVLYGTDRRGLASAGSQVFTQESAGINGLPRAETDDRFGTALASGDFNGDGRDDLAIGVPFEDRAPPNTNAGVVHVLYGSASGLTTGGVQLWAQDSAGVAGDIEPFDRFGETLTSGDFDGDEHDDLAIGVPGEDIGASASGVNGGQVTVLYGSASGLTATGHQVWHQGSNDGTDVEGSVEAEDQFGSALAAGDFDGDDNDDLAIGVPREDQGANNAGVVNVLYGSSSGLTATGNQLWHQASPGITGTTTEADDQFGSALASGDFDLDLHDDLAIGVPLENRAGQDSGIVHVLYGSGGGLTSTGAQLIDQDSSGIDGTSAEAEDHFGEVLAAVNRTQLAIAAPGEDRGAQNVGVVHLLSGSLTGGFSGHELWYQDSPGMLDEAEAGDQFGLALAAGSFNGTFIGYAQGLAIGVPRENVNGVTDAGAVAILTGLSATTVVDFEGFADQTRLTLEYEDEGVVFPKGVRVRNCSSTAACDDPHSPTSIAWTVTTSDDLVPWPSFQADFTAGQHTASVFVRPRCNAGAADEVQMVISAIGPSTPLGGNRMIECGSGWHRLSVQTNTGANTITGITVQSQQAGCPSCDNNFDVDDLVIAGSPPPADIPDVVPPEIDLLQPPAASTQTSRHIDIEVLVTDNRDLQAVDGEIIHEASGATSAEFPLCGPGAFTACPVESTGPVEFSDSFTTTISADTAKDGVYEIRISAIDHTGNDSVASRTFTLDLPEPPPPPSAVFSQYMEINQGVQPRLCEDQFLTCTPSAPVFPEKDTVVRYYLYGIGGPRPGFTGDLNLTIWRTDGSTVTHSTPPNAGTSTVDLQEGTISDDELLLMRADPSRTLNFVIPGAMLENADRIQLDLDGVTTDPTQIDLFAPNRLGLNIVRMQGYGGVGSAPTQATVDQTIVPYLKSTFPAAEVRVLSTRTMTILPCDDIIVCPIQRETMDDATYMLRRLWLRWGDEDAPSRFNTSDPHYTATLGVVDRPVGNASGIAYLGDPSDEDERLGGTALTVPLGDVAAHEIGHALGLIHAGTSHGECDGGDCDASWPNPHGTVGEGGGQLTDFGVVPQADPNSSPGPSDFGEWSFVLVDPCPTLTLSDRNPCTLGEQMIHDFMSYGSNPAPSGFPLVTGFGAWVSSITYGNVHAAICCGIASYSSAGTTSFEKVDALLVDGYIDHEGNTLFLPVVRKPMSASRVNGPHQGPYSLAIYDATGQLLYERSFDVRTTASHCCISPSSFLQQAIPYMAGVHRIIVQHEGSTIFDETASANVPEVQVTSPNGGEVISSDASTVTWEASDSDGDTLLSLIQYSPDCGQSWTTVSDFIGDTRQLELVTADLPASNEALIRVSVSDGINTSVDESDNAFSIGAAGPAVDCATSPPEETPTAPPDAPPTATVGPEAIPGDADCSGTTNSVDALLILQFAASIANSLPCLSAADVNDDGAANALDAALILQLVAGMLDELPPQSTAAVGPWLSRTASFGEALFSGNW